MGRLHIREWHMKTCNLRRIVEMHAATPLRSRGINKYASRATAPSLGVHGYQNSILIMIQQI